VSVAVRLKVNGALQELEIPPATPLL